MDNENKNPKKAPQILELSPAQLSTVAGGGDFTLPIFEMGRCTPHVAIGPALPVFPSFPGGLPPIPVPKP